jgi:carbamoyl-phosphate synthase large subunit
VALQFDDLGFNIVATHGTSDLLTSKGIRNRKINKVSFGRPHVVDAITNGQIQFVINTGTGDEPRRDGYMIRRAAIKFGIPYATTIAGAMAMCKGIAAMKQKQLMVKTLQAYHDET